MYLLGSQKALRSSGAKCVIDNTSPFELIVHFNHPPIEDVRKWMRTNGFRWYPKTYAWVFRPPRVTSAMTRFELDNQPEDKPIEMTQSVKADLADVEAARIKLQAALRDFDIPFVVVHYQRGTLYIYSDGKEV